MKTKKAVAIIAASLLIPTAASAQILNNDPSLTIEVIKGNMQDAAIAMKDNALKKAKAQLDSLLTGQTIDATNNGFANMIVRTTQQASDLYNLEALKEMTPAISACGTSSVQAMDAQFKCQEQSNKTAAINRAISKNSQLVKMKRDEQRVFLESGNKKHLEEIIALDEANQESGEGAVCSNAAMLLGGGGETRGPNKQAAADCFIKTIVGEPANTGESIDEINLNDSSAVGNFLSHQRKEAYRGIIINSLESINSVRKSPNTANAQPSELHRLKEFNDQRWGNEKWMRQINNTPLNGTSGEANTVSEPQLLRELVAMQAFSVNLSLLQYEQSLRDETIQAALLATKVN